MRTAIVIGAGPAGLAAANHLADAGVAVSVLEAKARIGGRAGSDAFAGTPLNEGPHALFAGGAGRRELVALGIELDHWNPLAPAASFFLTAPDALCRLPPGGPALGRFLAGVLRGAPVDDTLNVTAWLAGALPLAARPSAAALVRVTSYTADHDRFSAAVAAAQLRIGLSSGVRYLGDWQALPTALMERAGARGVAVHLRSPVRALARAGDAWVVRTDADELRSDIVVLAAGGPATARRLLAGLGPGVLPEDARPAEAASLDLILKRLPREGRRFALGTSEPHYLAIHSRRGADRTIATVAAYLTPEDRVSGTRERLERVAELMLPGWREELLDARHLPRMTVTGLVPGPGAGGLAVRPDVDAAGHRGLAVAGDWVGPEGLLVDASLASGARAARALVAGPAVAVA